MFNRIRDMGIKTSARVRRAVLRGGTDNMPRVPESRPDIITIDRGELTFTLGYSAFNPDIAYEEAEAIKDWLRRWNAHHPEKRVKKLSPDMLKATLLVKDVFKGAVFEDFRIKKKKKSRGKRWQGY